VSHRAAALACLTSLVLPTPVLAHDGRPLAPHDLWSAWTLEPGMVLPLALSAALYATGVRALWRHAGGGRGIRRWEAACFAAGWLVLALSLVSPLHALGGVLFSAHMTQHELMMVIAAPLLVLGRPLVPFVWALPGHWRPPAGAAARTGVVRGVWWVLTDGRVAWTLHAVAIWAWHAPSLYATTLRSESMHTLQHASFFLTGLLFWWVVLRARASRLGYGVAMLAVFTTAIHTGALGVLLTVGDSLWVPAYATTTAPWGLSALEDQQLAGLIMWIPAGIVYLIAALALIALWLREADRRVHRWEASAGRRWAVTAGRDA
jgi:cytochrome c oxidase assembly factor CtaG